MRQKTVLRVSANLYPETIGGVGIHVDRLASDLTKRGWKNTVLTVKLNGEVETEVRNGYKIIRVPCRMRLFGNKIAPSIFSKLLALKNHFSIIHAHSHLFFLTNVTALLRRINSHPLVITCHGIWSQSLPLNVQQLYMRSLGIFTLNSADIVICYTEQEKEVLKKLGVKEEKISVIPNGIDTSFFTPSSNHDSNNILLWVGRFVKGKRPDILIKAMVEIRKKIPDVRLIMLGRGPLKSHCHILAKKYNLLKSIQFLSYVSNVRLLELYRKSSVVLLTSEQEGVPRTILEALSCGIPVVVSDLPQIRPIVRNCGFCFQVGNIEEMAQKVVHLLLDSRLNFEFGRNGQCKIRENYSWDRFVDKHVQLYESLLNS
jgi:glycosyltransferase involved in cell wall biosynthesis